MTRNTPIDGTAQDGRHTGKKRDQLAVMIEAWLDLVRRDRHLPANAFHVAYEISLHFNRDHFNETEELVAWPTVDTIKEKTKLGKNTVHRMLDALIDAGHLVKETGVGRSNRNQYCALFDVLEEVPQEEKVPPVGPFTNGHVMPEKVPLWEEKVPLSKIKGPKTDDKRSHLAGSQPADLAAEPRPAEGPAEIPALRAGVVTQPDFHLSIAQADSHLPAETQPELESYTQCDDDDERRRYEEGDDDDGDDGDDDSGGYSGDDRSTPAARVPAPPALAAPAAPPARPRVPARTTIAGGFTNEAGTVSFTGAELAELRKAAYTVADFDAKIRAFAEKAWMRNPGTEKAGVAGAIMQWHNYTMRLQDLEQRRKQHVDEAEHGRGET